MACVESVKNRREISKPLGHPQLFVSPANMSHCQILMTMQAQHPEVINVTNHQIQTMHENGVPLSIPIVCSVLLGITQQLCPMLLDGQIYKISRDYV